MTRKEFTRIIEGWLIFNAALSFISGTNYMFQGNNDRWFSRHAFAIICIGLWYVAEKAANPERSFNPMSVDSIKLDFKDGSSAEVDFNETDPGHGKAPLIHLWPAPGTTKDELQAKVQSLL